MTLGWSEVWRVAAAIGLLMLLGRALLTLFAREIVVGRAEACALWFLLGAGGISLLCFWLSPFFNIVSARWLVSLVTVALALCASWRGRGVPPRAPRGARPVPANSRRINGVLWAGIALQCAALVFVASRTSLGWDGLINFEMKARMAFLNDPSGTVPLYHLADSSRTWSHPAYPLLLPLTEFWIYTWLGSPHQGIVKLLFPAFYMSLVGLFYGMCSRLMSSPAALLACLGLGLLPSLAIGPGGAITGYADVPLTAAVFGAVSFAYLSLNTGRREHFVVSALLSAVAVWTKREGLVFAVYVLVAVVLARALQARKEGRAVLAPDASTWWLLAMPAIVAGPWLWLQRHHTLIDHDFSAVTFDTLSANLSRVGVTVQLLARELLLLGHWALLWPAFGVTLFLAVWQLRDVSERFLLGAVLVPMTLYTFLFVFSAWTPFTDHVGTALPRLILPLAPVALFATIRHLRASLVAA